MIKAPPGLKAAFRAQASENIKHLHPAKTYDVGGTKVQLNDGEHVFYEHSIVAFDDEGDPLIVHKGKLTALTRSTFSNYVGIAEQPAVVQLTPCSDFVIWSVCGGELSSDNVVAWALMSDGAMFAVRCDDNGFSDIFDPNDQSLPVQVQHRTAPPPSSEWVDAIAVQERERDEAFRKSVKSRD